MTISARTTLAAAICTSLLVLFVTDDAHGDPRSGGRQGGLVPAVKGETPEEIIENLGRPPEETLLFESWQSWLVPKPYYKTEDWDNPDTEHQLINMRSYITELASEYDNVADYLRVKNLEFWSGGVNWDFTPPTWGDYREENPRQKLDLWRPHPQHTLRYVTADNRIDNKVFEPVLRPLRNFNNYTRRELGVRSYMYGYAGGFAVTNELPGQRDNGSFAGFGAGINWIPWEIANQGIGRFSISFYRAYDFPRGATDPGGLVGSALTINNNLDSSKVHWGQLQFSQTFLDRRLVVEVGKINHNNFYFYNWYAGDETWHFQPAPFVSPSGLPIDMQGNRPGIGGTYFLRDSDAWISGVVSSPHADRSKFDFSTVGDGHYTAAMEFGKVLRFEDWGKAPNLTARFSVGVHHTNTAYNSTKANPIKLPGGGGWGMTMMYNQELTDALHVPNVGVYASMAWSEEKVANVNAQIAVGFKADYVFGRRDDGFGAAIAYSRNSKVYRLDWKRHEWTLDAFYRFQVTEDITMGPEYTLVLNPSNPQATKDYAHVFQWKLLWLI